MVQNMPYVDDQIRVKCRGVRKFACGEIDVQGQRSWITKVSLSNQNNRMLNRSGFGHN